MSKSCQYCSYLRGRETKSGMPYGYCEKTKLILFTVQQDCVNFKRMDK